jgi:hypothetical protein
LWAITIPLIVNANTVTSTLNWANTSYPLYAFSSNGATGSTGGNGISAITAYRVQSQTSAAPATPSNTSGPTAPSGWSLVAPSVAVGQVLWYTFGRYNSSSATLDGVPSNQTAWGTPTAASIFQDIRSDNWNGSTPPTYGIPSSYGTVGYYISQATGNCYFNNGIFRGDLTGASGTFTGTVQSGSTGNRVILNESPSAYLTVYDSSNNVIYSMNGEAGLYTNSTIRGASSIAAFSAFNAAGYTGNAINGTNNGTGHGIVGIANYTGTTRNGVLGISAGTGSDAAGVYGASSGGVSYGMYCFGQFGISSSYLVTNLNAQYLNGLPSTGYATSAIGNDAYAANRLNGSAGLNVMRFVKGTITGASVASFISTNKPGLSSTSNVWLEATIDGTTVFIPVWT